MTALIVHPAVDFNTFVSLADANTYAEDSLDYALWSALSDPDKTRWLFASFIFMTMLPEFIPPDLDDPCLGKAQIAIILNDLKYGISNTNTEQQTRTEKFGSIMKENFKNEFADRLTPSRIPDEAWSCLVTYGAIRYENISGVSTIRRTR